MRKKRKLPAKLCGAKLVDGSGRTCRHSAGWGTGTGRGRCKKHGGNTPTHRKAAQLEAALEAVAVYGLPVEISAEQAIINEVHRSAGIVAWYQAEIAAMERGDLVFGIYKERTRTVGQGETATVERRVERRAAPNVLAELYLRERKHHVGVCRVALAAGYAERDLRIAEGEAAIFTTAMRGMFKDLGVEDHPQLGKIVRRHLTLIVGGKA